jgi:hypothetical protein
MCLINEITMQITYTNNVEIH